MKASPKQALLIVVAIVLTGEALAELMAEYGAVIIGAGIAAFAGFFVYTMLRNAKRRNQ